MALDLVLDILTWIFVVIGGGLLIIGGWGILKLPDVFTRMHGASIIDTLGVGLILIGLMFQAGLSLITLKLVLILVFIFFTSPTTTHALARALIAAGITPEGLDEKSASVSRGGASSKT